MTCGTPNPCDRWPLRSSQAPQPIAGGRPASLNLRKLVCCAPCSLSPAVADLNPCVADCLPIRKLLERRSDMPRRKSSLAEDLVRAPWWVSLVLALLAYRLLPAVLPTAFVNAGLVGLIALVLVAVAAISAFRSLKTGWMLERQTGLASLRDLPWKRFEDVLGEVSAARVRSRRDTWRRSRWWRRFDSASRRRGYRRSMQTLERRPEVLGMQPLSGLPWYCGHLSDQGAEHLDCEPVCAFAERSCDLRHRTRRPRRGIIAKLSSEASCDARRAKDWYRASTMSR